VAIDSRLIGFDHQLRVESSLYKMMVGGEGVGQVVFSHHLEGNAIRERLGLVESFDKQDVATGHPLRISGKDGCSRVDPQPPFDLNKYLAISDIGKPVAQFDQHKLACEVIAGKGCIKAAGALI